MFSSQVGESLSFGKSPSAPGNASQITSRFCSYVFLLPASLFWKAALLKDYSLQHGLIFQAALGKGCSWAAGIMCSNKFILLCQLLIYNKSCSAFVVYACLSW